MLITMTAQSALRASFALHIVPFGRVRVIMPLDATQMRAVSAFKTRRSVAIMGAAGSGKSFLLQEIPRYARSSVGEFPFVAACALTNQAASGLGGSTIHSLFGAPPHWKFSKSTLISIVNNNAPKKAALKQVEVIVIDEIALLTAEVFNSIDAVFRDLAKTDELSMYPFGGRQIVVAGDPFQLEAIGVRAPGKKVPDVGLPAFSSMTWFLCFGGLGSGVTIILSRNHRQCADEEFYSILGRMRFGKPHSNDIERINKTSIYSNSPPPNCTRLCLYKSQVQHINEKMLSTIHGEEYAYIAQDWFCQKREFGVEKKVNQAAPRSVVVQNGMPYYSLGEIREIYSWDKRRCMWCFPGH